MTVDTLTREAALTLVAEQGEEEAVVPLAERWLARGDGIAVYTNHDLGSHEVGRIIIVSYGSPEAQLETDDPPATLPDIGGMINWRYQLTAVYREVLT